jgi:LmbE family N-acetylglucosaminyl deacetylase
MDDVVTVGGDPAPAARTRLPAWRAVLAVVAHPDDESFGLGAVLAAFTAGGAAAAVLCFTHGEASTLHAVTGDLHHVRNDELAAASALLGITRTVVRGYPDGRLAATCRTRLVGEVVDVAHDTRPDGLLVFDPSGVTGHPDHAAASAAALAAADLLELPVLGWTLPAGVAEALNSERGTTFTGHDPGDIDYVIHVDRDRQRAAAAAHASQALPTSVLWRRLTLLGDDEHLRQLRSR